MKYLGQPSARMDARLSLGAVITLLFILAGCGDDPVAPRSEPGIHFLAGANASDTVGASPVQALRVEVRGPEGRPAAGQVVRANGVPHPNRFSEMEVARLEEQHFSEFVTDTTDAAGIVHFRVRMGGFAGPARVVVTVPALGLQDTARFEVLPGAAWAVAGLPEFGAVPIGGTLTLDAHAVDRWGNVRSDPVTYTLDGSAATLSGEVVSGVAFGEVRVTASVGAEHSQNMTIPVVPDGVVSFQARNAAGIPSIHTMRLDGSNLQQIVESEAGPSWGDMMSAWVSPNELIYSDEVDWLRKTLFRLNLETGERSRLLPANEGMAIEQHPQIGDRGASVYFSGGTNNGYWLYRKPLDGGPIERVSPEDLPLSHRYPAPSPDGNSLAYPVQGYGDDFLEIMDLRTGAVRPLGFEGLLPRWAPDGSRLAYLTPSGELRSVKPDGTGAAAVARNTINAANGFDWSPAGDYLVASAGGRLALVEMASGAVVTVGIPGITDVSSISSPAWRPEAR